MKNEIKIKGWTLQEIENVMEPPVGLSITELILRQSALDDLRVAAMNAKASNDFLEEINIVKKNIACIIHA